MAHKLGAYHHLPHGVANALLIELVMRYNADPAPVKMGTFSQYPYPHAKERYCEMARFAGITGKDDDEVFENFIKAIAELKEKVGIKRTIKDYGVKAVSYTHLDVYKRQKAGCRRNPFRRTGAWRTQCSMRSV